MIHVLQLQQISQLYSNKDINEIDTVLEYLCDDTHIFSSIIFNTRSKITESRYKYKDLHKYNN